MNRGGPILLLALAFALLAANVSSTVMWVICGVSILALIALVVIIYLAGQFVGPGTLVDDARLLRDRFVDEDGEDVEVVEVAVRRRRDNSEAL